MLFRCVKSPQINLLIQCNLNQNPSRLCCRNWKADLIIYVKTEKTYNSKRNFWKRRTNLEDLHYLISWLIRKTTAIKIVWHCSKYKYLDQWDRRESPEIDSQIQWVKNTGKKAIVLSGNGAGHWFSTLLSLLTGLHNQLLEATRKVHIKVSTKQFFQRSDFFCFYKRLGGSIFQRQLRKYFD